VEHFIPISHGGGTTADNCVPACSACNFKKHAYLPRYVIDIPKADMDRVQKYLETRKPIEHNEFYGITPIDVF
jgi:5-methylcytosine-specific restriction endonuclease McrA